jgi:hypothetical protein
MWVAPRPACLISVGLGLDKIARDNRGSGLRGKKGFWWDEKTALTIESKESLLYYTTYLVTSHQS